ncbi:MAG: apolipoprotein N-acyltransferase [Aliivibrio sp.]|uniref:apolipoprotein N-acyltransferase n=1 Tax=Aliivibrio sp. TaxID=1872443 RepID=UPI001A40024E|nr:apolipoprotein N-acyltransferase [Aliivibrio sp.]
MITLNSFKRPVLAVFVGALTTLAFAPYSLWPIALLTPAILLYLLQNQSLKTVMTIGFSWGFGQFSTGISWIHISIDTFGGIPKAGSLLLMFLLVSYLSAFPALFSLLLTKLFPQQSRHKYLIAAPLLWITIDWLRGWLFTGFPWLWLGYSQIDSPLASFAPVLGVEAITLLSVLISGSLAYSLLKKQLTLLVIPLVIALISVSLHWVNWVTPVPERSKEVALIQGNIDQATKWVPKYRWPNIMKYMDLTRKNWDADIIIWPEAAIPAVEGDITRFLHNADNAARLNNSSIITGIVGQSINGQFFNNIITLGVNSDGEYNYQTKSRYSKHHLLPFGEFVPFENILRPIAPLFNLPMSSFKRGKYVQPNVNANGAQLVATLCYEIVYGEQVRQNTTDESDYILTLSNDAWFGDSIGPLQHMEMARMRALELGKPLIRSTNNGVTAITDYRGKIVDILPQFKTAVLRSTVVPTDGTTPYRRWGSWPLYLITLIGLSYALWRQKNTYK